ncbi:12955_t:CDS:2 [Gigaspora margarita]|uniref:12955_t:CDS:1 n=1 Tax=Gigaspora margarita TaxID=4874 RepID=A0ABN7VAL2_GIGMA|nr:12955_t:CDS:2 [Gigaspora margarita]
MEANELPNIAELNKEYFNNQSSTYDANPTNVLYAKKCAEAILREVKDLEGYEIMDFACGTGLISQDLCAHVKSVLGVDSSQNMVNEYNKKVSQQGIDKEEMQAICLELKESEGDQLNGRKFDLIVCVSAYHHLDDIDSTTRMLASYLKQGGELVVVDLKKHPEVLHKFHGENKDHVIPHRGGFFPEELEKAFLTTGMLENVSSKIAFSLPRQIEKDKEHIFEWFLARGKKI